MIDLSLAPFLLFSYSYEKKFSSQVTCVFIFANDFRVPYVYNICLKPDRTEDISVACWERPNYKVFPAIIQFILLRKSFPRSSLVGKDLIRS